MSTERYFEYNIHNILKIRTNVKVEIPSIFMVNYIENPNLTIRIGNFPVNVNNTRKIDRLISVGDKLLLYNYKERMQYFNYV